MNLMNIVRLHQALNDLSRAIDEAQAVVKAIRDERDPLASHIYLARRHYRNLRDTKGDKRHARAALLSWQQACELGYRGNLNQWLGLLP